MFPLFFFLFSFYPFIDCGRITPSRLDKSIVNTVTNANQYANYTFFFILDTSIPINATLQITFPQQYSSNLGIDIITSDTCSVSCTISSYAAYFTFPSVQVQGVEISVSINNVLNPLSSVGTGNFQLSTSYNSYIFDENKIFGTLGIGPEPGKLTSCYIYITNQNEAISGKTTEYRLSFITIRDISYQSFMRLTLPIISQLAFPSNVNCGTYSINGLTVNGTITCTTNGNILTFQGLTSDIPLGFEVGLKFNLVNPPLAGNTGTFKFEIFRMGTSFLYDARDDIPSVSISPNVIGNVTLTSIVSGTTLSLSKVVGFELSFSASNPIPVNGIIMIQFPSTFSLAYNSKIDFVYIVSGIVDYSSSISASFTFDSTQIIIGGFQSIPSGTTITLRFNAITPSVAGVTTPLDIKSFSYAGGTSYTMIDRNFKDAFITVQNYRASSTIFPNGISISNSYADSNYNTLKFTITTSSNVPPSGYISIRIPSAFSVDPPTIAKCLVDIANTQAQACTSPSANVVLIKLPVTTTYYLGVQNTITLSTLVKNPSTNGTFLFDISTYGTDGTTLLESWTDYVILSGALLTTASGYLIGSTGSQPNSYTDSIYSIMVVKFTLLKDLPTGTGLIELRTYPPWDFDLGTGLTSGSSLPCEPISGISNIVCVLKIGNLNSPTCIIITGFTSTVTAGTAVEIHFPKIRNPITSSTTNFDLYLINVQNRIYYVLNYKSIVITSYATATAINTKAFTFTPTPSPVVVASSFSLTFFPKFSVTIPAGGYILIELPKYDVGFFTSSSTITCTLQAAVSSCKIYPTVQWILITSASSIAITGTTPTITIQGLVWPNIVYDPSPATAIGYGLIVRTLKASTFEDLELIYSSNYITHQAQSYTTATVTADRPVYNAVGVFYTFVFQANNDISAGSDLYLVFPSIYNLLSSPLPWLFNISLPSYTKFTIVDLITAKISGVGFISHTSKFSFQIGGVKNPGFGSASTGWTIQAKINGNSSNSYSAFTVNLLLNNLFSPAVITFNSLSAYPSNNALNAIYTFDITTNIPYIVYPTVQIFLIFPSENYVGLPTAPICNVSLGMNYFSSISLAGSSFLIQTAQPLSNTSQRIVFTLKNIKNPSQIGPTASFSVVFTYDGTIIAQTDTSQTYSILIFDSPNPISLATFSLIPINEAEKTTIQLEFSVTDALDSNTVIKLIFPSTYDAKLASDTLVCTGLQSINAELSCWADDATLNINGIISFSSSQNIIITIENIINLNYMLNSNTGYIALATQKQGSFQFLDYLGTAGLFTMQEAPAYCLISGISLSNTYSRLETDYTFNLTFFTSIPTMLALGKIVIEFPSQYDIPDNNALSCSAVSSSNFGTSICSMSNNIAIIQGNTKEFSGNILITLSGVKNPYGIGSIGQFFIYSYDGYNQLMLERSFTNIGTFSFTFSLKGAPVQVNSDNPLTLQVGTQTPPIPITINNPSILNLTFQPTVSGMTITPSTIILYAGTVSTNFRVAVPETLTVGSYSILWTTENDNNLLFTPLKKTLITVVSNAIVTISMSPIYDLPLGGQSLPITFTLPNPPNSQLEIDISFDNSSLIKATPSSLVFSSGVSSLSTVFAPTIMATGGSSVNAKFSISGTSKASYSLGVSSYSINFLSGDLVLPAFQSVSIGVTARTYVTLLVTTNKPVQAYYMVALAGTNTPAFEEVSESGPPTSLSTQSVYGKYVVHLTASITLDGLLAGNNYTVFVYIQDQLNRNAGPQSLTFQTFDNYRPAEFSIRVNKVNPTSNEITWLKQNIAYYLALNISNIEQRKYDLGLLPSDTVDATKQTILYFYMIAMPFNTIMPTPLILANSIQAQLQNITTQYPNLDPTYTVKTAEFPIYVPNVLYLSNLSNATDSSLSFMIKLDNYGKVFALALPLLVSTNVSSTISSNSSSATNKTNTTNSTTVTNSSKTTTTSTVTNTTITNNSLLTPTSFQIYKGIDRYNLNNDTKAHSMEISAKNQNFSFVFSGLNQNTTYIIFITAGSVHPYVPDLADSSKISKLIGTTLITPVVVQTTNFGGRGVANLSILLIVCVLLLFHIIIV